MDSHGPSSVLQAISAPARLGGVAQEHGAHVGHHQGWRQGEGAQQDGHVGPPVHGLVVVEAI